MSIDSNKVMNGSIIDNCYVVQLSDTITDNELGRFCQDAVSKAHSKNVKGMILSLQNMDIIDSHTVKMLVDTTKTVALLGTKVVWCGLKPGVVSTILDLNIHLDDIYTCLGINEALDFLRDKI